MEEEGRLSDPRLRDNFIERVFAYRRLREMFVGRWTTGALVKFHTAHKLTLLAHSPAAYKTLGQLVAHAAERPRAEVQAAYEEAFMRGMGTMATPRKHVNVLQHMLGYFRDVLDDDSRAELAQSIADYQKEILPLVVPVTLFRHHVRRCGISVSRRPDLPGAAPEGADAQEPRVEGLSQALGLWAFGTRRTGVTSMSRRRLFERLSHEAAPSRARACARRRNRSWRRRHRNRPRRPAAPATPAPWYAQISVNGLVSASYVGNVNSPSSGTNQFRVFDTRSDTFALDVAELVVQRSVSAPGDAGFRVDLTFGSLIPKVTAAAGLFRDENGVAGSFDLQQAYFSYIAPAGRGLRIDAGKFTTYLGYEVIEGYDGYNDNHSHSFLFGYAQPITHTGLRVSYPFSGAVSAQVYRGQRLGQRRRQQHRQVDRRAARAHAVAARCRCSSATWAVPSRRTRTRTCVTPSTSWRRSRPRRP